MALITVPSSFLSVLTRANVEFDRRDFETRSVYNSRRQVLSYPSASIWRMSVDIHPQDTPYAGEWRAFFMKLRGRENWFKCPMPQYPGPSTGYTGSCEVDGGGQAGFTLNLKSMTPNADVLAAGDFFTVVDQCFVADEDVTADGSGEASVSFDAPLRTSPVDGATVTLVNPYFLCASTTSTAARWMSSGAMRQSFTFEGAEHIG